MIITFGKYKGKDLEDIPSDYLKWLITEAKCDDDDLIEAANEEYNFRDNWKTHSYS